MEKDELTYKIIGCAMKVHNTMGPGFQEVIYQRCLAIELARSGLAFLREKEQTVFYEDIEVGTRRANFVVEEKVVVELKALVSLEDVHIAQAKNYTVAYDFPLGLLINFGSQSLQYKLLFNPKYYPKPDSENPKNSINSDSDIVSFQLPLHPYFYNFILCKQPNAAPGTILQNR